jgi:endonuclease-3
MLAPWEFGAKGVRGKGSWKCRGRDESCRNESIATVKRQEKADRIQAQLDEFYPELIAPLLYDDPYTLLIAVLLSAQCTDIRVNQVTPKLFARARTPEQMTRLSVEEIRNIIRPCGLSPSKSKAIAELSSVLVDDYDSRVPDTFEELEALRGVGHKTASVVMVQAFGHPAFPVDTHIHRLAARWGLSKAANVVQTERDLKALFARESWGRVHLQMIYFGREYCPARGHELSTCPICSWSASKIRIQAERK